MLRDTSMGRTASEQHSPPRTHIPPSPTIALDALIRRLAECRDIRLGDLIGMDVGIGT